MSTPLSAINEELRRLQQDGVDRVFVDSSTVSLLKSLQKEAPEKEAPTTAPSKELAAMAADAAPKAEAKKTAVKRQAAKPKIKPLPEKPAQVELPEGDPATQLAALRKQVENCPVCNEHLNEGGKIVFGEGTVDADIFFCGEAPGADEEAKGEPFVGKAGQLLTKIIKAMGLEREEVYIANILKWRPEHDKPHGNRPPTPEEMDFCLPYLKAQIEIVQPKVIVALGNTAVTGLLGPDPKRRMGSIRGTWHEFAGTPLMITFHPSYLLRNDTLKTKRMVWEDLLQVMEKVGMSISEKQQGFFLPKS